jgi:hypothetical protein
MTYKATWKDTLGENLGKPTLLPWCLLISNKHVYVFDGNSIEGVVTVVSSRTEKNGSSCDHVHKIELEDNVSIIMGYVGSTTGSFVEGLEEATGKPCKQWEDVASILGVPLAEAQKFVYKYASKSAEFLDENV